MNNIGQALAKYWRENLNTEAGGVHTPLIHFLRYNYTERYVKLCTRTYQEPVSFSKWLFTPLKTLT